jgi:uncharacterized protein GlcG (DUF336 family)
MTLSLLQASTVVDTALEEGERRGFLPLCVVVVDAGGHLLALKRDHRASVYRPQIATAKASGCIGMGFGGRELARRAQAMPAFFGALSSVLPSGLLPVAGGVLIRAAAEARVIGAVGISGDTSENDECCAVAGILAAGLIADTGT